MPSSIGAVIKEVRERQRISQNQLAKRSGVSQSAISSIESTTKSPSIDTIRDIASALNTTVTALLKEIDNEQENQPTAQGSELDSELVNLLADLSPSEVQRVQDFVAGLKASRIEGASPQE